MTRLCSNYAGRGEVCFTRGKYLPSAALAPVAPELPRDLREWVGAGALVTWVDEEVEKALQKLASDGSSPPDDYLQQTLGVLAYGCLTGVYDPEELCRLCGTDVAFRLLWRGSAPLPQDLAKARRRYRSLLQGVVSQVMGLAAHRAHGTPAAPVPTYYAECASERLDIARHMSCQE